MTTEYDDENLLRDIDRSDDNENEPSEALAGRLEQEHASGNAEKIFHLFQLLIANTCTQQDIFEQMKDYYQVKSKNASLADLPSSSSKRKIARDLQFIKRVGYEIKQSWKGNDFAYHLVKGPAGPLLFNEQELDALVLLYTLFADPTKYMPVDPEHLLPALPPRNPLAEEILALIERLTATLPPDKKKAFDNRVRKPYIYLNVDTVTDYLPHRATIDIIVHAITHRQQLCFE